MQLGMLLRRWRIGYGLAVIAAAGFLAPACAQVTVRSVVYGSSGMLADIYESRATAPVEGKIAVLIIHGGGWSAGSRHEFKTLAHWLVQQGTVPILIDYRLTSDGARWPAQARDVEEAMWMIRENAVALRVNPSKVVALGGSAGGHLAAWLGTTDRRNARGTSSRANAIVSIWGPWDLTEPPRRDDAVNMINALMGDLAPRAASPLFFIDANAAPALLIHGARDSLVPPRQSSRACSALRAAKVRCDLVMLPDENHSFAAHPEHVTVVAHRIKQFVAETLK